MGEPASHPVPPPCAVGERWLLDSREVARLLGISRTKTYQMMAAAELPTVRIGRCIRVSREALLQWVLKQAWSDVPAQPTSWLRLSPPKSQPRSH
jgi:prophage regulatory protein